MDPIGIEHLCFRSDLWSQTGIYFPVEFQWFLLDEKSVEA